MSSKDPNPARERTISAVLYSCAIAPSVTVSCVISPWAGLAVAPYSPGIPEEFDPHIPSRGQVCQVFVKWRVRRDFGVKFLAVSARAIGSARRRSSFPAEAQRSLA